MKRRAAVELIVIGSAVPVTAQEPHQHDSAAAVPGDVKPTARFFTPEQFATVDILAEMIIPADEHSGGAHEALVADFIDNQVLTSDAATKKVWTDGLAAVDAEAKKRHKNPFSACSEEQRAAILATMAEGEQAPKTELHRFFKRLKAQTMSGYYTSNVGLLRDLQYKGVYPIAAYPPCEHPEHKKGGE